MAKDTVPRKTQKSGVWKPFLTLIRHTSLPYFWMFILVLINLFATQLSLLFPNATQRIFAGDISLNAILFMIVIIFSSCVVGAVQTFLASMTQAKISRSFRRSVLQTTLRLPVPYFDKNMASQIISRNTEDTTTLSNLFGNIIPSIPSLIYGFIGTFAILFSYQWRLVLLAAVMIPIVWLLGFADGRISFKWNNRLQTRLAELTSYLSEILSNIPLVKVFVKEKEEDERGQQSIDEIYRTRSKAAIISNIIGLLYSSQNTLQTIIAVVGGAYLVSQDYISIDVWIAFYLYSSNLIYSYSRVATIWSGAKSAQGAARRISEISSEAAEDTGRGAKIPAEPGTIVFRHVTFRYDRDLILNDVNISFPQGKVTALVGKSGAGKSTIFGLLERFYLPESGEILLNGKSSQEYDLAQWRRSISYVSQNSPMFSGSIRENMTYGLDRPVTDEELADAAKKADIYGFIQSSEKGFDTQAGEKGNKLSGGQRQRIAIARAFLKNAPILLLDEATFSLDPEARANVEQALERLMAGRTTIIVAHEINSIQNADQIVVLEEGTVSGCGDDSTLMRENKLYRSLKNLQNGSAAPTGM